MAESIVSSLVQTLTSIVGNEVSLLKNVRIEVTKIQDEFSSMQAFLRDADAKEDMVHGVKAWVKQVRDVAFETEDVVDEFVFILPFHPEQVGHGRFLCIRVQLQSLAHLIKNLKKRHRIANQIQEIKTKVSDIARRKQDYGLIQWEQGSTSQTAAKQDYDPREDALFINESQLVGIHKPRDDLIQWLVGDQQHSALGILSVYGEGGLGKTTLVKKVFENKMVVEHFPNRCWVAVSQTPDITKLLQDLINQLLNEEEKGRMQDMDATKLKVTLRNHLGGRRYVVVLDDVWNPDTWKSLKNAFPDDIGCSSRIVVTTRYHDVAQECILENHGLKYELPHLKSDDALKLFAKKALPSVDVSNFPSHLKVISQKFLDKCSGLPLAIVSIGGLLRNKNPVEWDQIYENLGHLIRTNEKLKDINSIISLSYIDLPFHLKPCFLYLCIFSEDYSINCNKLLRLWAAEGFLEITGNMTKEDVGKGYLDELISRSLVQATEFSEDGKVVKTCRIHDMMREFILLKAREQDFVAHLGENEEDDGKTLQGEISGRRLSILNTGIESPSNQKLLLEKNKFLSHLRSFVLFSTVIFPHYVLDSVFKV